MKISGNAIRPGYVLEFRNRLWLVLKTQHTQPGKGGAYMQVEMKDIKDGTKLNERFRSADTVEKARLDQKEYQFLYAEDELLHFMDTENYDQITLPSSLLENKLPLLQDGMQVTLELYDGDPISVALPEQMTFTINEADPVVKGQTAASSYKPAILENGLRVMVPPFIESGEAIVINTEDLTYVERAKT